MNLGMFRVVAGCVAMAPACDAAGQNVARWSVEIDYGGGVRAVTPRHPSCAVTVTLSFEQPLVYAFAATRMGVVGGGWDWSELTVLEPFSTHSIPPGNGVLNGNGVRDILAGQLHVPPTLLANPMNPAPIWRGVWTATEFTARRVNLRTSTTRLDFYTSPASPGSVSWPVPPGNEGRGAIGVVPAPGWWVLGGMLGGWVAARRRR